MQSAHCCPPLPQAMSCEPCAQMPLMQHPVGHELGSQGVGTWVHLPPLPLGAQVASALHVSHCPPPLPHAVAWVPSEQAPLPAQHPVQFEGPQLLAMFPQAPM